MALILMLLGASTLVLEAGDAQPAPPVLLATVTLAPRLAWLHCNE
jgi:hypothetical protein